MTEKHRDPYEYRGPTSSQVAKEEVSLFRAALRKALHRADLLAGEIHSLRDRITLLEVEAEEAKFMAFYGFLLAAGFIFSAGLLLGFCVKGTS